MTEHIHGVKKETSTIRKKHKIVMEKRRRNRINECLIQLKSLLLQAMKKENSEYSKLEKADILEMTVKYLRGIQRQQFSSAMSTDPNAMNKYASGFNECASEAMRYLDQVSDGSDHLKTHLNEHLSRCAQVTQMTKQPQTTAQMQPAIQMQTTQLPFVVSQPLYVQIPVVQSTQTNSLPAGHNIKIEKSSLSHLPVNVTQHQVSDIHRLSASKYDNSATHNNSYVLDTSRSSLIRSPDCSLPSSPSSLDSRSSAFSVSPCKSDISMSSSHLNSSSPDRFVISKYELPSNLVVGKCAESENVWRPW